MAKVLKKVDVVTIGAGWTGGIIAAELTKAGFSVLSLERGAMRSSSDFVQVHDEWRYGINYGLMQDCSKESVTFRHNPNETALPMRKMGSFLLGNNVGGAGVHWNGWTFRFMPYDFEIKTLSHKRYGDKLGKDYTLEDWGITYKEMEPYFDRFEKTAGICGEPNPLAEKMGAFRSSPYPQEPLANTAILKKFEKAAKSLNLHTYRIPAANSKYAYTNPDGEMLNPCQYCGYCERFGCEYDAKASPLNTVLPVALSSGKYEIRTNSNVIEILKKGDKVTGVKYINTKTMEEFIQPADIVVLTSYMLNNAKLLMVSNIGTQYDPKTGKGTLGRNYCYQMNASTLAFFDEQMNTYMGSGALGTTCDDFNGDNFDHSGEKFLHGSMIAVLQMGSRPIQSAPIPAGVPTWGAEFKKALNHSFTRVINVYAQGASLPHVNNYLSLDPTYKDAYGLPLLRITYNFTNQDRELHKFATDKTTQVAKAMNPKSIKPNPYLKDYSIIPYQSTHNTGGTTMGSSPHNSVVNNYLQHWDMENLFVVGAGNFQHNSGYNPTDTAGALAYRCAEGIIKYHKNGKKLV
ncbi:GMC family oxidoreductase [uncultured Helicobacter sp.]|uniref:GMC family oxidoreductase n=1 Tax=uncultured Helicobacter sp. TaxID=175537 RepID=UPI00258C8E21|nr:GMC family oxidoreductase [uncultured Helicobacter sp.]